MRITEGVTYLHIVRDQARASQQLDQLSNEASSGLRVTKPSDDPVAYAAAVRADAQLSQLDARSRAATAASGDLDLADGALSNASDLLSNARSIAVEAASGTQTAADRANSATEITQIREQMVTLANTRGAAGYLFGGTATGAAPFNSASGAFTGNDLPRPIEVADGTTSNAAPSGAQAFTAAGVGGRDVLADLASLATALSTNNTTGIQSALDNFDAGQRQLIAVRTQAGLASERFQNVVDVAQTATTTISAARASDVEGDVTAVFSAYTAAQTTYQRSLDVTKQILSMPTLAQS